MANESLLRCLSKYAFNEKSQEENILTETLAYLLREDKRIRRVFLDLCFDDEKTKQKYLSNEFEVNTQVILGRKYVDLQLACGDKHSISVENKVISKENIYSSNHGNERRQIDLYAGILSKRVGKHYLIYLAPSSYETPKVRGSRKQSVFLGTIPWERLYHRFKCLNESKDRLSVLAQLLNFLEDIGMADAEGFTKAELRSAGHAFGFVEKCRTLVKALKDELEETLENMYGSGESGISSQEDDIHFYYTPKRWKDRSTISIGVCSDEDDRKPYTFVMFSIEKKRLAEASKSNRRFMERIRGLMKTKWRTLDQYYFNICKFYALKAKGIEDYVCELKPKIIESLKQLQANQLARMLASLERRMED